MEQSNIDKSQKLLENTLHRFSEFDKESYAFPEKVPQEAIFGDRYTMRLHDLKENIELVDHVCKKEAGDDLFIDIDIDVQVSYTLATAVHLKNLSDAVYDLVPRFDSIPLVTEILEVEDGDDFNNTLKSLFSYLKKRKSIIYVRDCYMVDSELGDGSFKSVGVIKYGFFKHPRMITKTVVERSFQSKSSATVLITFGKVREA